MGFLLVFFPEDGNTIINKKGKTNHSSSSSSPSTPLNNTFLRFTNSTNLLSRAQSTISICGFLICITLLLLALSTFEPTTTSSHSSIPRRQLTSNHNKNPPRWTTNFVRHDSHYNPETALASSSHALQGMGILYRRGTKAMNDLVIAHVIESVTANELRLFFRLFHCSGLTSKSDLLFIFPSRSSAFFDIAIQEENASFAKLIALYSSANANSKPSKEEEKTAEPIWGRSIRTNLNEEGSTESTQLSYGSVVGFEADELDPENSLSGFLDHAAMSLRRWACYPMLLGRVKRNFKHVMLVDVDDVLLFDDPLSRVRNLTPESISLLVTSPSKHGKKNSEKPQSPHQKSVYKGLIMGGGRGIRRLSNVMLTQIARAAIQHRRKNSVSESGLLNHIVGSEFILKNVNVITSIESIPDVSSLAVSNSNSGSSSSLSNYAVVRRGNSNMDLHTIVVKHICSLPLYSSVFSDC